MTTSMYDATIPGFVLTLNALSKILDKLAHHCEVKKIDPAVFLSARLYPDMLEFKRQIQITSDTAKGGAARLAGVEVPKFEDTEVTIADLKARIAKTLAFLATLKPEQFAAAATREIKISPRGVETTFKGDAYLHTWSLPNFYFHATTAYALLRHNGLEIGKQDYLGRA